MLLRLTQLFICASPALAGVAELWWNITYVDNVNPDGLYARRAIGVNGTWPYVILYLGFPQSD